MCIAKRPSNGVLFRDGALDWSCPSLMDTRLGLVVVEAVGTVGNAESAERFPSGCGNRGVRGAISKVLWETCGKVAESSRPAFQAQRQVFHRTGSRGSFHSLGLMPQAPELARTRQGYDSRGSNVNGADCKTLRCSGRFHAAPRSEWQSGDQKSTRL